MSKFSEKRWTGKEKIVIAIDCGTTQTGVAYSYLFPNGPQTVQRVVHWPGQDSQKGEAKIPTVVWYDRKGNARAFGAEANATRIKNQAEDEEWQLAEHFKLHLHPTTMRNKHNIIVQPLPRGIGLDQIYADFFGYILRHTETFFQDREIHGTDIWARLKGSMEFVIAHPNGWAAHEQGFLRKAAVMAGFVPSSTSHERIHVVSEGEASVHFVMVHGDFETRLKPGAKFAICDAGGSTVDTTLYTVSSIAPALELKELRASACVQAGAIFVNQTAMEYFSMLFASGNLDAEDLRIYTQEAVESFELEAKRGFEGPNQEDISIKVGGHRFTERAIGIRRGILTVSSAQVERFFAPWVDQILGSVLEQLEGHGTKHILLVGGFGDSPYLRARFRKDPNFRDAEINLANDSTSKAVAEGAAIWYIQRSVVARATRFAYGVKANRPYDASNPQHNGRKIIPRVQGDRVADVWSEVVPKNQVIHNNEERRRAYRRIFETEKPDLADSKEVLFALTADQAPYFITDNYTCIVKQYAQACTIRADLSNMHNALTRRENDAGRFYWSLEYEISIMFGTTELAAAVIWKDPKGREHRSHATVVPEKFT